MSPPYWNLPAARFEANFCWRNCLPALLVVALVWACLWYAPLQWPVAAAVAAAVALVAGREMQQFNRHFAGARVARLHHLAAGWQLQLCSGEWCPVIVRQPPLLSGWILAARFSDLATGSKHFGLCLVRGAVDDESWRQLSVCLRYGAELEGGTRIVSRA